MEAKAYDTAQIGHETDEPTRFVLKRDLVIPAGTHFVTSPSRVERYGPNHVEALVGLSKDSCGAMTYFVDPDDPALADWFEATP